MPTSYGCVTDSCSEPEKERPDCSVRTHYAVPERIWFERVADDGYEAQWILAFRRITNATNERTSIFAVLPRCITGSQSPAVKTKQSPVSAACLLANLNSLPFDFAARRRVGGTDLNHFILHQLPVLTPPHLDREFYVVGEGQTVRQWLLPRVLELSYTAWDLRSFAQDCGCTGPPFQWNEERRYLIRCELDAAFFHLYLPADDTGHWLPVEGGASEDMARLTSNFATPRDAVAYMLDTFPVLSRREEEQLSEYRTKRIVLEIYDQMQRAWSSSVRYESRLRPAAADPQMAHADRSRGGT
jgi:hypothetical protein